MFKYISLALLANASAMDVNNSTQGESQGKKKHCHALAMSGGGVKGAFEAGAIWGMYYAEKDKESLQYDVLTGVSAGSINTLALGLFNKEDQERSIQVLSEEWQKLTTNSIYENWKPGGILTGLNKHSGIFDTTPMDKFLSNFRKNYGPEFKRKFTVSAVDVNSGSYMLWDENSEDPIKATLSSSAIPFIFPTQHWPGGKVAMDGGTVWNTNLVSAINKCKEIVDHDEEITLDIIVCDTAKLDKWEDRKNTIGNWLRYQDVQSYHDSMADIQRFLRAYPKIDFRYFVQPDTPLPGGLNLLNGDNSTSTFPMQLQGREDGANVVHKGPGVSFEIFKEQDFDKYKRFNVQRGEPAAAKGGLTQAKAEEELKYTKYANDSVELNEVDSQPFLQYG